MRRGTVAPPPPSLFGLLFRSQAERVGARLRAAAVAGGVTLGRRFARGHAQACLTGGRAVVAGAAIRAAGALGAADRVDAQLVRAAVAVGAALGARTLVRLTVAGGAHVQRTALAVGRAGGPAASVHAQGAARAAVGVVDAPAGRGGILDAEAGRADVTAAAVGGLGARVRAGAVAAPAVRAALGVEPAGGRRARGPWLANPRHAAVGRGAIRVAGARVPGGAAFAQRAVAAVTGAAGHTARAGRGAGRDARGARVTVVVRRAGLRAVADDRDGAGEGRLVAVTARVAVDVAVAGVDPWRISTTVRWMMGAVIVVELVLYAAGRQRY